MYELIYEDLSTLGLSTRGAPISSEITHIRSIGHFNEIANAKAAAEKSYGEEISWEDTKQGYRSLDLEFDRYHINVIVAKDAPTTLVIAKVRKIEADRDLLHRCLETQVCPKCGEHLDRSITDDVSLPDEIFNCSSEMCGFTHTRAWA